jgi:hypothetical protein
MRVIFLSLMDLYPRTTIMMNSFLLTILRYISSRYSFNRKMYTREISKIFAAIACFPLTTNFMFRINCEVHEFCK